VNAEELNCEICRFQEIVGLCPPEHAAGTRVALALRELYGMKSAAAILSYVRVLFPNEIESALSLASGDDQFSLGSRLPTLSTVQDAIPKLLDAVAHKEVNRIVRSLDEMGIFALCSTLGRQFGRLESCMGLVIGRARLIPLVELAIFAAELGAYDRAASYIADAQAFAPEPPELHDVRTVAGLVALAAGQVEEAKKYLADSVRVCREDEYARLMCSIRPFNLMLAEKLLEHGEKAAVLKYLEECQRLWSYATRQISSWIYAIQHGQKPDFLAPGIRTSMDKPTAKIHDLTIRSVFLTENPDERNHADVGELRARYKRDVAAAIKGKLGMQKN